MELFIFALIDGTYICCANSLGLKGNFLDVPSVNDGSIFTAIRFIYPVTFSVLKMKMFKYA